MAQKPLRSITFPGLSDVYTVPEGGGSGGNISSVNGQTGAVKTSWYFEVTGSVASPTTTQTVAQIMDAQTAGFAPICKATFSDFRGLPATLPALLISDMICVFGGIGSMGEDISYLTVMIDSVGNLTAKTNNVAVKGDIPKALKNPNALNIKIGNTTTSYDGSAAKTVEIPDGGSVQADWSQNDAQAADFVKNRPGAYMTNPVVTEIYNGTLPEMAGIQMDYVPTLGDIVTIKIGAESINCTVSDSDGSLYFATASIEDLEGGTATNYVACIYLGSQWMIEAGGTYIGQNAVFETAIRQAVKIPEKFLELENVKDVYWITFEFDQQTKTYFSKKIDGTYAEYTDIKAAIDNGKLVAAVASVFGESNNVGLVDGYGKHVHDMSVSFYEVRDISLSGTTFMNLVSFRWKNGHIWEKIDGSIEFSYDKPMPSTLTGKQGDSDCVARSDHSHPDRTSIQFLGELTDGDERTVACGNVSPDTPFVVSGLNIPIGAEITLGFDDYTPATPVTMVWGGTATVDFSNSGNFWRVNLAYNACTDAYTLTTTRALTNLTLTYKTVPTQTKDYQKYVLAPYTVAPHLLLASPNGLHKLTVDDNGNVLVDGESGGTDASLGITGAAAGKIPKIKAVDAEGKPTEWEAAEMPASGPTDAQVSSAVSSWLTEHPEATTTVQDGAVTVKKLGYGKHIYGGKPYFCGAVGTGAQVFGSIGVVVPCKAGDTIYTTITVPTNASWNVPKILTAFPENQYGDIASITLENLAVNNDTKQYAIGSDKTTAKALYIPQNFIPLPAANNGSVEDALAWINKTMGTDGKWCAQNVPFTELDSWYQTAQTELFDIDESCNKLMYASLYQAVSKLVGAKVAVLGDSLTEQSACSFITSAYNERWMENVLRDTAMTGDDGKTYKGSGWFALIARKYKIKWWCAGHGAQWWYSTTERPNGATAMVRKLIDGTDEFDYIILEYGTNDILSGYTHIGTAADEASETATTSCGAIKWCIEQLQTRFPEASIVVILPNIHSGANGEAPAAQQTYLDAVVPILKKYGVRRVNMAEDSGIVKSMMSPDGVHLRKTVVSGGTTYYTNDTPAVRKFSRCLEAELLKA